MSQDHAQPIAQLLDIHTAAQPGWWPPAPGWWVLAALAAVLLVMAVKHALWWISVRRRRRAWMRALENIPSAHDPAVMPHEFLAELNRLFRGIAVKAFPDTACARLEGEPWVDFIRALMPEGLDATPLAALAAGPYQPAPVFDAPALQELAATWVRHYG